MTYFDKCPKCGNRNLELGAYTVLPPIPYWRCHSCGWYYEEGKGAVDPAAPDNQKAGLKPCPFCGAGSDLVYAHHNPIDGSFIHCRNCGMMVWNCPRLEKLIEQWNRRVKE